MSINYEEKLNELGNALCGADRESSAYSTLRGRYLGLAYDYVRYGDYYGKLARKFRFHFGSLSDLGGHDTNSNGLEYFTTEIMDACDAIISGFSADKGEFIAYFKTAMYNAINSAIGEMIYKELHGGIRTSLKKAKIITRLIKDLKKDGLEDSDKNILLRAVEYEYNLTEEDLREYKGTIVDIKTKKDSDDEGVGDITPLIRRSTAVLDAEYIDPQNIISAKESSYDVIWMVEGAIGELVETRKPYISDCMTSRLSRWLGLYSYRLEEARYTSWFSEDIFAYYEQNDEPMPETEIAKKHGMYLSSLSRSINSFIAHIANTELYQAMYDSVVKVKTQ